MVACEVAHALFNVPTKIARVRAQSYLKPEWSDLFNEKHISIDYIISPEIEVARAIHRRILTPGAFDMIPFADDKLLLIGVRLGEERSEEHTSELQSLMRSSYAVFCLKKKH